jgi:hypothetical protein
MAPGEASAAEKSMRHLNAAGRFRLHGGRELGERRIHSGPMKRIEEEVGQD